jgi:hypothetical protein
MTTGACDCLCRVIDPRRSQRRNHSNRHDNGRPRTLSAAIGTPRMVFVHAKLHGPGRNAF